MWHLIFDLGWFAAGFPLQRVLVRPSYMQLP